MLRITHKVRCFLWRQNNPEVNYSPTRISGEGVSRGSITQPQKKFMYTHKKKFIVLSGVNLYKHKKHGGYHSLFSVQHSDFRTILCLLCSYSPTVLTTVTTLLLP